ncbi:MAG: sigma-70 family RNA polymerase sigma factor [Acetobacteraceae bacterium]|jgi:RNA polymerase sigma factor (sigma-70 family)
MNDMASLIEPIIPALRRYARGLVRDRSTADDLVQDCLELAVSRWHQRRVDGNPRAWVFAIFHNLFRTRLRRMARRPLHFAIEDTDESALSVDASQDQQVHYREVLAALAKLPEEHRSVLLLVTVEDLSYAETAKVLDVPIGTVMSRLSRARDRLSDIMGVEARPHPSYPPLRRVK